MLEPHTLRLVSSDPQFIFACVVHVLGVLAAVYFLAESGSLPPLPKYVLATMWVGDSIPVVLEFVSPVWAACGTRQSLMHFGFVMELVLAGVAVLSSIGQPQSHGRVGPLWAWVLWASAWAVAGHFWMIVVMVSVHHGA